MRQLVLFHFSCTSAAPAVSCSKPINTLDDIASVAHLSNRHDRSLQYSILGRNLKVARNMDTVSVRMQIVALPVVVN